MNRDNTNAPAWAWVLSNARLIERVTERLIRGTSLDRADFRQGLVVDLVAMFGRFDAARGGAINWVWMRATKLRRSMVREAVRASMAGMVLDVIAGPDGDLLSGTEIAARLAPVPVGARGEPERVLARVDVRALLQVASPSERRAALVVLDGGRATGEDAVALRGLGRRARRIAPRRVRA